jgi:hypothetical protein
MGYDLDTPFLEKKPLGVEQVALEDSRDQKWKFGTWIHINYNTTMIALPLFSWIGSNRRQGYQASVLIWENWNLDRPGEVCGYIWRHSYKMEITTQRMDQMLRVRMSFQQKFR